jgi:hypothetical protein
MLHQFAGAISFLSRIAAFLCLSRAYRFDNRWQSLAPTARHVAMAFLTLFFTFVLMIPWNFGGLAQRVTVAVGLLWILLERPAPSQIVADDDRRAVTCAAKNFF